MTIERLRDAMHATPFQPFSIVMGDGTRYAITHPEMIAFNIKSPRTVFVAHAPERTAALDLLLMTALEFGGSPTRKRKAS
jgi:hypothetical protein